MSIIQKIVALFILSGLSQGAFSQKTVTNWPYPTGVFRYKFEKKLKEDTSRLYYFISPFKLEDKPGSPDFVVPKPIILDENGFVVWYFPGATGKLNTDFKYFENKNQFGWINRLNEERTNYILMNSKLEIFDTITNPPGVFVDAHEFSVSEDGHFLIGGKSIKTYDTLNHVFTQNLSDSKTTFKTAGYMIQEFNEKKRDCISVG
ncbi:MAG: hypothetical protein K1X92_05040 [Bacteroidia bacterium]|nr:hypothetical protein [Bacteroidia bacterium]